MNGGNNQTFFDIPREDSASPLMDNYIELDYNVNHRAVAHALNAVGDFIKSVILGPIALFIKYRLTNSRGKELEEIDNAHVKCSLYKNNIK